MKTKVLKSSKYSTNLACDLLKNGEIVALPTETVYGLFGDARKSEIVEKIFTAKGRPQDNPLIVHISNTDMLDGLVEYIPSDAQKLADNFWPGPLTIIMPKGKNIADAVCAGLNSVGIRMPSNKTINNIIEKSGIPLAGPSANISGRPSPTNAKDVLEDMQGRIPLIIDGGESDAGVESTVISTLNDTPIILRPGVITKEDIELALGKSVDIAKAVTDDIKPNEKVLSPGMKYKHYAPKAEIILIKSSLQNFIKYINENQTKDTFIMCFTNEEKYFIGTNYITYGEIDNPKEQAHLLFATLRKLDKLGAKKVYARCPSTQGISLAVYNRLIRSCGFKVIEL